MATHLMQRPLIILDENLENGIGGITKSTKPATKKGTGFGSRKALNDITNKSSLHHDVSTKKKNVAKEDLNIAGEKFLHDHSKCIEAKQKAMEPSFWDTVLPGHDSVSSIDFSDSQPAKSDPASLCCNPEPVELPISEFYGWLKPSQWDCPSSFPIDWDSLPSSPFGWDLEPAEFVLKEEIDC